MIKIKEWIKKHSIPNEEDIDSKRVHLDGDEKVLKIILSPNEEWKYGNIEIIFHIDEPQK